MVEKVVVVGLGYVGLPTAALIADKRYEVLGVDVNEALVSELQAGRCPLGEAEIIPVVERALSSGRLRAAIKPDNGDIFIICVPTPITPNKRADLSMVTKAVQAAMQHVRPGNMVILESTSPIGTTESIIAGAARDVGLDPTIDLDICYCPERVFPGNTINEILKNDRVVGGLTPRAALRAKGFYESFCAGKAFPVTAAEAEFSKLMENTYRDVNIALANSFAHIAERSGIDVSKVIEVANRHPRVNVHTPGPGVGGHCIPVDPWFLVERYPEETKLIHEARLINDRQPERLLAAAGASGLVAGEKVAILGAAYRGNIDDARDTPTEKLIDALADAGLTWATHDPHVTRMHIESGRDPNLTADLIDAVRGAAAVFVMTDHTQYKHLAPASFSGLLPRMIVDGRRLVDTDAFLAAGVTVISVGAPTVSAGDYVQRIPA
ncbi:MAG: nucleotide sugar dehydrogenase [Alphaproteobacteria bacterium]|nr:nucleotide sugar dehydrogenase [Alphaproteobacteria bacterium]